MTERTWVRVDESEEWVAQAMRALRLAAEDAAARARDMRLEPVVGKGDAGLPFSIAEVFGDAIEELPVPAARAAE